MGGKSKKFSLSRNLVTLTENEGHSDWYKINAEYNGVSYQSSFESNRVTDPECKLMIILLSYFFFQNHTMISIT